MNVLILGVNGFLGNAVARRSAAKNLNVFGLSRSVAPTSEEVTTYLSGNRTDSELIFGILENHKIDIVVDILGMTTGDTLPLIERIDGKIQQYVLLSSSDVYRNYELFHRRTTGTATRESVDEDSLLRETRFPYRAEAPRALDAADKYLDDYDKIPIEAATKKMTSNWTILRLPMVFGPGDKQNRFAWAIKPMRSGASELVLPQKWLDWHSTYGYVENVAEAIALTLGNQRAINSVFNVGEPSSISQLEWAKRIADAVGWRGNISYGEDPNSPLSRAIADLDLSVPFRISSERIRKELGYEEILDQAQALKQTFRGYVSYVAQQRGSKILGPRQRRERPAN